MSARRRSSFWHRHSLTLVASLILLSWIVLYALSSSESHIGSFFGNAIADWSGLVMMALATKHLYEKGSAESKQPRGILPKKWEEFLREHSLSLFLVVTGAGWAILFARMDAQGKWGEVVGNIVSEWTQVLGLVLMTKRLVETGSKEGR